MGSPQSGPTVRDTDPVLMLEVLVRTVLMLEVLACTVLMLELLLFGALLFLLDGGTR